MKIQYTPPCYLESLSYWLFCKWDTGFRVCGIQIDWETEEESRAKIDRQMDDVESMKIKVQGPGRVVFYSAECRAKWIISAEQWNNRQLEYYIEKYKRINAELTDLIAEHHNRHSSGS